MKGIFLFKGNRLYSGNWPTPNREAGLGQIHGHRLSVQLITHTSLSKHQTCSRYIKTLDL